MVREGSRNKDVKGDEPIFDVEQQVAIFGRLITGPGVVVQEA